MMEYLVEVSYRLRSQLTETYTFLQISMSVKLAMQTVPTSVLTLMDHIILNAT